MRTRRQRARRRRHGGVLAAAVIALGAAPTVAQEAVLAQPPLEVPRILPEPAVLASVEPDSEVRWLVDQMGSPIYAEREAAMQSLLQRRAQVIELCALLERPETDAEQRFRILSVLRHLLVTVPSGALGITMQLRAAEPGAAAGVEITDLLEGMPAEQVLERRDRITHIDGRPLVGQRDLVIMVQTKRPGDNVLLTVSRPRRDAEGLFIRDGEGHIRYTQHEVSLRLGSVDDLHDPVTGRPQPNGLIRSARAAEAAEAERRYLPEPSVVQINGADTFDFIAPRPAPVSETEVENHSIIKTLRQQLRQIERQKLEITPENRQAWNNQSRSLERLVQDPSLSKREAELMLRIQQRFDELLESTKK